MSFKGAHRHKVRKYSNEFFSEIETRRAKGESWESIANNMGVTPRIIENQYYENCSATSDKALRVPKFDKWDFSGDNLDAIG